MAKEKTLLKDNEELIFRMLDLLQSGKVDEILIKRDDAFPNKFEFWAGNQYLDRRLID